MFTKSLIILAMILILGFLASGLVFLIRDEGKTKGTVISLSFRIGLSLALFVFLFVAFYLGLIQPHGLV